MGMRSSILDALKTPLGTVLMLVTLLGLAGMSIAQRNYWFRWMKATISGDLTAEKNNFTVFFAEPLPQVPDLLR